MATVIGDYISEPTRFHEMIANAPIHHPHQYHHHPHEASSYRSPSRARQSSTGSVQRAQSPTSSTAASTTQTETVDGPEHSRRQAQPVQAEALRRAAPATSHIPSPPTSSSPAAASGTAPTNDGIDVSMESEVRVPVAAASHTNPLVAAPTSSTSAPRNTQQQPSPSSDDFHLSERTQPVVPPLPQTVIRVKDLAHVRALASREGLGGAGPGLQNDSPLEQMKYDVSGMPIGDIIEMVAALLTKITSTNDLQHDAMQRNVAHQQQANQSSEGGSAQISPMSHSVLAFHGKNVPAITILSYLSRIHKYCPTTFEVFLSLLVYFDRMTERVNDMVAKSEEARRQEASRPQTRTSSQPQPQSDVAMRDGDDESDSDLADDDDDEDEDDDDDDDEMSGPPSARPDEGRVITTGSEVSAVNGPSTYFVVDSFNIHRLIIAGVTCSSKFFSDVFYTNSRYAKFLVLNDFRLAVPVEDLEAYATMLVEFYAREVVSQTTGTTAE